MLPISIKQVVNNRRPYLVYVFTTLMQQQLTKKNQSTAVPVSAASKTYSQGLPPHTLLIDHTG
jgi:hypothetical protein